MITFGVLSNFAALCLYLQEMNIMMNKRNNKFACKKIDGSKNQQCTLPTFLSSWSQ